MKKIQKNKKNKKALKYANWLKDYFKEDLRCLCEEGFTCAIHKLRISLDEIIIAIEWVDEK